MKKRRRMLNKKNRRTLTALLFLLPVLAVLAVFVFGPVAFTFYISLFKWDFFTTPEFVGLGHYANLFTRNTAFQTALVNTVMYTVLQVLLTTGLALLLAFMVTERSNALRILYFMPVVTSAVADALIWKYLYEPHYGLINYVLGMLRLPTPSWLLASQTSLVSIVFMDVWKSVGFYLIILLAGLKGLPRVYYEAARTDGASTWQSLRMVTIPLLKPTLLFVLVMNILGSFQVFTSVFMLTQGGPGYSSYTISFLTYRSAFNFFRMGEACAISVVLTMLVLAISVIQMRMFRKGGMMEY